ncbi:hypothetical protein CsSME_00009796 [Camellia sinensis var. sinensis]
MLSLNFNPILHLLLQWPPFSLLLVHSLLLPHGFSRKTQAHLVCLLFPNTHLAKTLNSHFLSSPPPIPKDLSSFWSKLSKKMNPLLLLPHHHHPLLL